MWCMGVVELKIGMFSSGRIPARMTKLPRNSNDSSLTFLETVNFIDPWKVWWKVQAQGLKHQEFVFEKKTACKKLIKKRWYHLVLKNPYQKRWYHPPSKNNNPFFPNFLLIEATTSPVPNLCATTNPPHQLRPFFKQGRSGADEIGSSENGVLRGMSSFLPLRFGLEQGPTTGGGSRFFSPLSEAKQRTDSSPLKRDHFWKEFQLPTINFQANMLHSGKLT